MKILMLGHSGVGKTTFMACMYAALQRRVGGFSIRAASDHDRLMHLAKAVWNGEYPAPTHFMSTYDLKLLHNGGEVLEFGWTDYRGGALEESASSSGMKELKAELETADGVIAFFDGPQLERGGRAAREIIGRIMVLVQHAIEADERIVPVALVVTKVDLITDAAPIYKALTPLAQAINSSRTVHGALILTACGEGFAHNMEKPTMFVLHKGLLASMVRMHSQIQVEVADAERYESNATFLDWVSSRWDGVPTYGDMAQRAYARANNIVEQHNALVEPANALAATLTDIEMF